MDPEATNAGFFPQSLEELYSNVINPVSTIYGRDIRASFPVPKESLEDFNGYDTAEWTRQHWFHVFVIGCLYALMCQVGPTIMANRDPIKPKTVLIIWNISISIFSGIGAYVVGNHILHGAHGGLLENSWYDTVCTHSDWYSHGNSGRWIFYFVISKIPELMDTVFIMLAKRPITLLQSWHHFSVMLWSWHSCTVGVSVGILFGFMNYTVHFVMYFYYAMTQISPTTKSMVRPIAIYVTRLQLLQMFGGMFILGSVYFFHILSGLPCATDPTNNSLALICYTTYFILFAKLYIERYVFRKSSKGKKKRS